MSQMNGLMRLASRRRRPSMHKVQFSRGVSVQKEFWRSNTLPVIQGSNIGCFGRLRIAEENARFILSALVIVLYLLLGAYLFHWIERPNELIERANYAAVYANATAFLCSQRGVDCSILDQLLDLRGNLSAAGLMSDRAKWDYPGAFYFVGTVISTIGFGMTIPRTNLGRAMVICYGFVGCASCVLFFNLFLERVVTAFAYILRYYHRRKVVRRELRKSKDNYGNTVLVKSQSSDETSSLDGGEVWKPSLYKVFLCLFSITALLIGSAAALYSHVERWSYFEGLYFSFVSFTTIGFGDYVTSQQGHSAAWVLGYRLANFLFLSLGCCCAYSLSNVTSVIIRQMLNWTIKRLDVRCQPRQKKRRRYLGLGLRPPSDEGSDVTPPDGVISLKEFLIQNQTRMLLLQKQLIVSANKRQSFDDQKISASNVGPMAILTHTFGED